MKIEATFFGKTRTVEAQLWYNNQKLDSSEVAIEEEVLWVERGEDWYALMSPGLRNKMVAVVTREAWLAAEPLNEWKDRSVAKQIQLTYNAVDYKALLLKVLRYYDINHWKAHKFTKEEWNELQKLDMEAHGNIND